MTKLLEKLKSPTSFPAALITQTVIGFSIVAMLFVNLQLKNGVIEIWTPYLLVYLAYLIVISPLMSKVAPKQITSTQTRKKYVTARDELVKAQKCAKSNPEDVMNYVRSAIELSIKGKFNFTRIQPMLNFLKDANKFDFPLPSYALIYQYFSEGSNRIHDGKLNTPFEVSQITRTVADFIEELDKLAVAEEKIEEFKTKCKWVD